MLIGNPKDFAIEAIVEPGLKIPSSVWGRMCVHVADTQLGDFSDSYCALYPAYRQFKQHVESTRQLWDSAFDSMSHEEIHDTVHNRLYGDVYDEQSFKETLEDERRFSSFDFLTHWGEQFDGYSSVIVCPDSVTMIIMHRPYVEVGSAIEHRRLPGEFISIQCSKDAFISVSKMFVSWFENEAKRLQKGNQDTQQGEVANSNSAPVVPPSAPSE